LWHNTFINTANTKGNQMTTTLKTLADAHKELNLANNGYVFANFLDAELRRQMERLVTRGQAVAGRITNSNGILVKAYFTLKAAEIYTPIKA
jgi:hypothetical protein